MEIPKTGTHERFTTIVASLEPALFRWLRRYLQKNEEQAKDVVQKTWQVLWRKFERYDSGAIPPRRAVFKIAIQEALVSKRDHCRHRSVPITPTLIEEYEELFVDPHAREPLNALIQEEEEACLQEMWHRLPVRDREILSMFYLQQLAYGEIGARLHVSERTVNTRLARARARAQQIFQHHFA